MAPGDVLGTFESLRSETGVAYSTVSEAVRLLRDRGVLDVRPGRGGGLFVAETGPVVRLRHTLLGVADDPSALADAVELRDHLEVLVDTAAARHCSDADAADLRDILREMSAASSWEGFLRANWSLHERIAALCPNVMARAVYVGTLGHLDATTPSLDGVDAATYRHERHQIHVELVEAIARGDVAAVPAVVARHNATTGREH